jgi:large subunit ribosomal protein L25
MANQPLAIQVEARGGLGTSNSRRLRKADLIPAVVYGHGGPATPVAVKVEDLGEVLHHAGLISIEIEGNGSKSAIVKEIQHHPLKSQILHIDFQEVKADEVITSTALIEPIGTPAGAAHGGQLEQIMHEVEIKCLPADMVETIEVDVSGMEVDDTMHLGAVALPEGIELTADDEAPVFQVRVPRMEEETEEGEEGEEGVEGVEGEAAEGEAESETEE